MVRRRLWILVRSIPTGWVTLLLLGYLVERPLLNLIAPILGPSWYATARLGLDCGSFAGTGWVVGYSNRNEVLFAVLGFAATLTLWDFTPLIPVDVPWLFRLFADTFHDSRYFDSFVTTLATHALLFGSLIAGAQLARPREGPVSLKPGV